MGDILLSQIPLPELINQIRMVVQEEIISSQKNQVEEKLLSAAETCKLFQPAITRPTLDGIVKQGTLNKYHFGSKVFYKYSEIMEALKVYKRYKK